MILIKTLKKALQMRNNIILLIFMILVSLRANALTSTPALFANLHPVQSAIKVKATYADSTISAATDPFASKTNKYCESSVVRVTCATKGCHVKWGASAPTASSVDYLVIANTSTDFVCTSTTPYISIIETSAGAGSFVSELD